jgi:hypothetical protein
MAQRDSERVPNDRGQSVRARQAAEALFTPKPPPVIERPPVDAAARQPRILKTTSSPANRPPVEAVANPEPSPPAAPVPPPHVARIRSWLKYGMTIARVAEAYRVPITEIKRLLGKP